MPECPNELAEGRIKEVALLEREPPGSVRYLSIISSTAAPHLNGDVRTRSLALVHHGHLRRRPATTAPPRLGLWLGNMGRPGLV